MIKEAYCSHEISKLLKKKGFDVPCNNWYMPCSDGSVKKFMLTRSDNYNHYDGFPWTVSRPTHQMAMAWLREEYKIAINILIACEKTISYTFDIWDFTIIHPNKFVGGTIDLREQQYGFKTYEEAVEAAIKYSLENLI